MADDFGSEYKGARESIEAQKAKLQLEQEILKVQREQNTVSKSNLDLAERQNELEDLRIKLQEERQVVEELLAKNDKVAAAEKAKYIEELRKEVELKEKSLALQKATADHADNQFKRAFSFISLCHAGIMRSESANSPADTAANIADNIFNEYATLIGIIIVKNFPSKSRRG